MSMRLCLSTDSFLKNINAVLDNLRALPRTTSEHCHMHLRAIRSLIYMFNHWKILQWTLMLVMWHARGSLAASPVGLA